MENKNVVIDFEWLDDSFSRGVVDDLEAACCLAGYDKYGGEVVLDNTHLISNNINVVFPAQVRRLYLILKDWPKYTEYAPLLWYLQEAVRRDVLNVKWDIILPKCIATENRKENIMKNYPDLAKKLDLVAPASTPLDEGGGQQGLSSEAAKDVPMLHGQSSKDSLRVGSENESLEVDAQSAEEGAKSVPEWMLKAPVYADEEALKLYKSTGMQSISQRKIAPKVAARFIKEKIYGVNQTQLDEETVRRYGLKGWVFQPPIEE